MSHINELYEQLRIKNRYLVRNRFYDMETILSKNLPLCTNYIEELDLLRSEIYKFRDIYNRLSQMDDSDKNGCANIMGIDISDFGNMIIIDQFVIKSLYSKIELLLRSTNINSANYESNTKIIQKTEEMEKKLSGSFQTEEKMLKDYKQELIKLRNLKKELLSVINNPTNEGNEFKAGFLLKKIDTKRKEIDNNLPNIIGVIKKNNSHLEEINKVKSKFYVLEYDFSGMEELKSKLILIITKFKKVYPRQQNYSVLDSLLYNTQFKYIPEDIFPNFESEKTK